MIKRFSVMLIYYEIKFEYNGHLQKKHSIEIRERPFDVRKQLSVKFEIYRQLFNF